MHSPKPDGEWREKRKENDLYFFSLTPSFPSLITWGYKKLKPQLPALPSSFFQWEKKISLAVPPLSICMCVSLSLLLALKSPKGHLPLLSKQLAYLSSQIINSNTLSKWSHHAPCTLTKTPESKSIWAYVLQSGYWWEIT